MALKGRLTSVTSIKMLSVLKFLGALNVTGKEIQLHSMTNIDPTLENGRNG
jgi:hypothetical protein